MSEGINNREYRQSVLKDLITELHNGKSVEEVKPRFEKLIQGVSVQEIAQMEQALIKEGLPVEQIQNLCDVHAAMFKGSIEQIHRPEKPEDLEGHPVHTFRWENREITKLINERIKKHLHMENGTDVAKHKDMLKEDMDLLWEIDKHYKRKENLLFPYMEKYGITAPPKVMWGVDDEIRAALKEAKVRLEQSTASWEDLIKKIEEAVHKVLEMIDKEENILFPMTLETLIEDEWAQIAEASNEFGYTLIEPNQTWAPSKTKEQEKVQPSSTSDRISFDAGLLTSDQINAILNTVPFDMTFVDKDDVVKYFTQGKERIFARPKTILGRKVQNCHPPASMHIVEQIVKDLKAGKKDHEDFWIMMGDKYVHIRYFAVRDKHGAYLGTLEVTQDIKPIQNIKGEKRLLFDTDG